MSQLPLVEVPRVLIPGGSSDHWFTPGRIFDPLHAEFRFELDPCGHLEAPASWKIINGGGLLYDIESDGLAAPWGNRRVWMNPPYSDITPWCEKAWKESRCYGALVVALLPAWTDRAWWHEYIEPVRDGPHRQRTCETRFIKGRVRFGYPGNPEGKGHHGGGFDPSVVVIWRPAR